MRLHFHRKPAQKHKHTRTATTTITTNEIEMLYILIQVWCGLGKCGSGSFLMRYLPCDCLESNERQRFSLRTKKEFISITCLCVAKQGFECGGLIGGRTVGVCVCVFHFRFHLLPLYSTVYCPFWRQHKESVINFCWDVTIKPYGKYWFRKINFISGVCVCTQNMAAHCKLLNSNSTNISSKREFNLNASKSTWCVQRWKINILI